MEEKEIRRKDKINWKLLFIALLAVFTLFLFADFNFKPDKSETAAQLVIPEKLSLPIDLNLLENQLLEAGVIDKGKWSENYASELNILWAFGLANKNKILTEGPMTDYETSRFASTGGWSLAKGDTMEHYSQHEFIILTPEQQKLVEEISQNIYRPCCGNSTYFPDCNHGMAMLGLLEILASQGKSKAEIYDIALQANSYWFPSTYQTIAKYFDGRGVSWDEVDAKMVLGPSYSSALGYSEILAEVEPEPSGGGAACGI